MAGFDDIERWGSAPGPRAAVIVGATRVAEPLWPAERALTSLISTTGSNVTLNTHEPLYEECLATQGPGPWEVIQTPQRTVERIGEVPVTDEMIAAARQANSGGRGSRSWAECIAEIYRAMAAVAPDPGDSLYEECLATQGPATDVIAARSPCLPPAWAIDQVTGVATPYCQRAALAPVELYGVSEQERDTLRAENAALRGRVEELESYSHALATNIDQKNAKDQENEAYQYLKRLFLHLAPQCLVLSDLLGVCTQLDNAIAGQKAENAELMRLMGVQNAWIAELNAKLATFGDPTPADLPDPPRRPDGTLVPQAKPLPVVRVGGDPRRIGG